MPRRAYAEIQNMCVEYEDKFNEHVATAKMVNMLICEALMERGRIPKDFLQCQYGAKDPHDEGFTPKARAITKGITLQRKKEKERERKALSSTFSQVVKQWDEPHPNPDWKDKWIQRAKQHLDMASARRVLQVAGELEETVHVEDDR